MTSPTKNSNPKFPNSLIESTSLSGSLEGLNSSLAQSAGELWPNMLVPIFAKILAHVGLEGFDCQ